ncbi:MAG: hypothetical protein ACOX46_08610 [Limnochordia bacterium]
MDKGHSIKFNKKFYFPVKDDGSSVYYRKGTSCLVIQAFDGNLYAVINDSVHALDEIPEHEPTSKNFDLPEPVTEPKKRYIPPMSHPWKAQEFSKHVAAQPHREIPEGGDLRRPVVHHSKLLVTLHQNFGANVLGFLGHFRFYLTLPSQEISRQNPPISTQHSCQRFTSGIFTRFAGYLEEFGP